MLSADGCIDVLVPAETGCCPPPLCGNDLCCTFVAFINLLPSGPLWDYWKEAAISYFQHSDDPAECPLLQNPECPSLILHAIYTVLKLRVVVHGALWPALRESNPVTAVTTLDDHLARLQWEDCYNQHCRSVQLGELTPLEIWSECGPMFCPPNYPADLELAVKRAVAIALTRANMGVIKNLCGLNWIVEPLGAEIVPDYDVPEPCIDPPDPVPLYPEQTVPCVEVVDGPCFDPDCDPWDCSNTAFRIHPIRDWLEGVGSGDVCETSQPKPQVPAYWDQECDRPAGLPERVWPGVLAAECIIRSMTTCVGKITREC
ncbi:hypothetical protein [Bradyrhizobium elkanii]|uniref:hypothetical protein n=1 Tax=Bradyrhizobium elkanii TaxID=29448 RepID=UPI0004B33981|nr:hypothetical protein [Bradyrhizobium elkanii]WLA79566.1 hypothetical protein QNJ99_29740 [Bradyrhizobium elkanii]